jgi:hypothetical protein
MGGSCSTNGGEEECVVGRKARMKDAARKTKT